MDNYTRLSRTPPDENGCVDFIANKTKGHYLNLNGINSQDAIDALHAFLCRYKVWHLTDKVIHTKKPSTFVPDKQSYSDISFMINFYNLACISKEFKDRTEEKTNTDRVTDQPAQQVTVKQLTNPNINHATTQNTVPIEKTNLVTKKSIDKEPMKKVELDKLMDEDSELDEILKLPDGESKKKDKSKKKSDHKETKSSNKKANERSDLGDVVSTEESAESENDDSEKDETNSPSEKDDDEPSASDESNVVVADNDFSDEEVSEPSESDNDSESIKVEIKKEKKSSKAKIEPKRKPEKKTTSKSSTKKPAPKPAKRGRPPKKQPTAPTKSRKVTKKSK